MEPESESCEECSRWKEIKPRFKLAKLLESLIGGLEKRIAKDELKPTVAEYLKLAQIEQDLDQDSITEIKVTWVVPVAIAIVEK